MQVDVEGAEREAMKEWLHRFELTSITYGAKFFALKHFSGVLKNVLQIGLEFHRVPQYIKVYFGLVQELYKLGYKTISWDPNLGAQKGFGTAINFFEIVFRKTDLSACKP